MREGIESFVLNVADDVLTDLHRRLDNTRWPEPETVSNWSQGVPLTHLQVLLRYWRNDYDWRRCEARLNSLGQFRTRIDDVDIHFLHVPSANPDALPLLLTHGWPGSVIEFLKVIGPLTDPEAHGGDARDAFHVVIPSLPGYGFSSSPSGTGWGVARIASAWDTLMTRLGYERYVAQGGDWGAAVTTAMGQQRPRGLLAIHLNLPLVLPEPPYDNLSADEARMLDAMVQYQQGQAAYAMQQMSYPQTLGYGLADSPAGQAAWIFEKLAFWADCDSDPGNVFSQDEMLDNIMLYWLGNNGASSARLYWESFADGFGARQLDLPVGCSIFPKEIYQAARSWAERCMSQLIYWNEVEQGGHFAAFEQPELFVREIRNCFRLVR